MHFIHKWHTYINFKIKQQIITQNPQPTLHLDIVLHKVQTFGRNIQLCIYKDLITIEPSHENTYTYIWTHTHMCLYALFIGA